MGWIWILRGGEENEKENIQRKGGRQLQKKQKMMRKEKNAKMHWKYEEDTWNKVRENKEKEKEIRESELGSEEKVEKGDEGEEEDEQLQRRRRRRKKRSREGEGEVRNKRE